MDGAKYHKRELDKPPVFRSKKQEMIKWLKEYQIDHCEKATKINLYDLIRQNKPPTKYVPVEIANRFGHQVSYTPPYHPELQPIEHIWGAVKNKIAMKVFSNMKELISCLHFMFENEVTKKTWLGAYKKVQSQEDRYWSMVEPKQDLNQEIKN